MSGGNPPGHTFAEFLAALPASDQQRWATLTAARRRSAEQRFDLFEKWNRGETTAEAAITAWGKSPSRFYRLAAQWREQPSLEALGVGIRAPRQRAKLNPEVVNGLQAKVADVVRLNSDVSVRRQMQLLLQAAGYELGRDIGAPAVRKIVETERWRVAATGHVGNAISFDCSAINFAQEDGRPYVLFIIIDQGTGIILGAAISDRAEIVAGYGKAARAALHWIASHSDGIPWAAKLVQTVMVEGADPGSAEMMIRELSAAGLGGNLLRASAPKRFGGQFRKALGDRVGRIAITPARTLRGTAFPDNGNMTPWPIEELTDEVDRNFEEHNAAVIQRLDGAAGSSPPSSLMQLLDHVARLGTAPEKLAGD